MRSPGDVHVDVLVSLILHGASWVWLLWNYEIHYCQDMQLEAQSVNGVKSQAKSNSARYELKSISSPSFPMTIVPVAAALLALLTLEWENVYHTNLWKGGLGLEEDLPCSCSSCSSQVLSRVFQELVLLLSLVKKSFQTWLIPQMQQSESHLKQRAHYSLLPPKQQQELWHRPQFWSRSEKNTVILKLTSWPHSCMV